MSHTTSTMPHPGTTARPHPRRLGRVVLASLGAGAVAAGVLTLVVAPGATEPVVTGLLLLGFAVGWGVLAMSTRRTGHPQRWARVPAAAMAATGAVLVATRPGDAAVASLVWAWAPLLLALVIWSYAAARRALPGRAGWPLMPVFGVLLLVAVGGLARAVTAADLGPAPGTVYAVGDHDLHLDCRGTGSPTVVLFNGLGEFSGSWARVTAELGSTTRICAYDRAGQAWSDDVARPQDGVAAATDLHALLAAAGEPGPYVLAGHSTGGLYALTYAARHPEDVAGMVLLDSSSPRLLTALPDYPGQYAVMTRGLALLPTLTRSGLVPLLTPDSPLPGDAGDRVDAVNSSVRAKRNARDELVMIPTLCHQAQALTTLGGRPLAVITAADTLRTRGWGAEQERLTALSSDSVHRTVPSSHAGLLEDTDGAAASSAAIAGVVRAVTTGSPLAAP